MKPVPQVVWMPGRVRTEIHLDSHDTGGAFCMLVDYPPAGWSLPTHLHRGVSKTIYVLRGEFEMSIGGERSSFAAGEIAHVPADVIHSGGNVGALPGQRIVIFSPRGMESFFLEVGAANEDAYIEPAAALAAAMRHGWRFTHPGT